MTMAHELYENLIGDLDRIRGNRGLLYFPMRAGGERLGMPLELVFSSRSQSAPYIKMPVWYERRERKIVEPTLEEYNAKMKSLRARTGSDPLHFIWDDVISEGKGTLTFFYWLMRRGIRPENIVIGCMLDNIGVTRGLCISRYYYPKEGYKSEDPVRVLEDLKRRGEIPENPDTVLEKRPASPVVPIIIADEPEEVGGLLESLRGKIRGPKGGESVRAAVREKYGIQRD